MIKYLITLIDSNAESFCYYKANKNKADKTNGIISLELLDKVIDYAEENKIGINFIFSNNKITIKHEKKIEGAAHVKILPFNLNSIYKENILILDSEDAESINKLEFSKDKNIILRLIREDIFNLHQMILKLNGKFKRLNLILLDLEQYTSNDINNYKTQINLSANYLLNQYKSGNPIELNFLSDRLILDKFISCKAGIDHITVAPNGKFYICPAFYHDNENNSIGDLENGITNLDNRILTFDEAPTCSTCDSYHCKQCVFLNRETFLEFNTPSFFQQCAVYHIDREGSRIIYSALQNSGLSGNFKPINVRAYNDPFYLFEQNKINSADEFKKQGNNNLPSFQNNDLNNESTRDLLIKIYKMNKEILKEFNK
jgi:CXXX repeat peptide maturase